jgi:hypothetical protein
MAWHCGSVKCPTHPNPEMMCSVWMMSPIAGSVGHGGRNRPADVCVVQGALNRVPPNAGGPSRKLETNGLPDEPTVQAIRNFQQVFLGMNPPDGRVDVGGRTYQALSGKLHFKRIEVHLLDQTVDAFEDGRRLFHFICVTGDAAHPTHPGVFKVIRKAHPYVSRTYNVPMNYALFFTVDGKALHQYHGPLALGLLRTMRQTMSDMVGSHGCVRLMEDDARQLYQWAPIGTRVAVRH